MELQVNIVEGTTVMIELAMVATNVDLARCTIAHRIEPDAPGIGITTEGLATRTVQTVALIDGWHIFSASCPSAAGTLETTIRTLAVDGLPERCAGFTFPESEISVSTLAALKAGMLGTWQGCVVTPWVPVYFVTVTFRADGTYSAISTETLDGQEMHALYYERDEDSPAKRYWVNDLQESRMGVGEIAVYLDVGNAVRDELRNIKLMGNQLEFELVHLGVYGPLTFKLDRT